jgi:hypothetical protein
MKLTKKIEEARQGFYSDKRQKDHMTWEVSMHTDAMLDRRIVAVERQLAMAQQELMALREERLYRVEYMGLTPEEKAEYPEPPR